MASQQKFRAAFNGFHREDVVNYIARMTHDHEVQVNGLNNEMVALKEKLAEEREKNLQLLAQIDGLRTQVAKKQAREELELFRQAERAQREAEEQIAQAHAQAEALLTEALRKAADSAAQVEVLCQAMADLREFLEAGSASFREEETVWSE